MHVLGISAGTLNGNSEMLLKAALQAVEKERAGVTTSMARIRYMQCPRNGKPMEKSLVPMITTFIPGGPGSDDPDDRPKLYEAIMSADAIIISSPVYSHLPPGYIKSFIDDTLGPGADLALALASEEDGKRLGRIPAASIDPRLFKPRVSAFMVVAGSPSEMPEQWTLGLIALNQSLYSIQATTVDQICIPGNGPHGSIFLHEEDTIGRAQLLGRRVASQLAKPIDKVEFLGSSEEGSCPYCHLLSISFTKGTLCNDIMCTTCGARGQLHPIPSGGFMTEWEQSSAVSHLTLAGKRKHIDDLIKQGEKYHPSRDVQDSYAHWKQTHVRLI